MKWKQNKTNLICENNLHEYLYADFINKSFLNDHDCI